jgi:glucose-1-phosphatase
MLRTCLFDLGNVLVFFSHERMCAQIGDVCRQSASEIRRLLIDSGLQWEFERGRLTMDEFHHRFQNLVNCRFDREELFVAASDIFEANAPALSLLDDLKSLGMRLVLLSNTSIAHFQFIRDRFDVLDRFDDFVLSFEVGAIKPEDPIFEAALKRIHCRPEECFYTDDIEPYVVRAREFGIDAEPFTDTPALIQQLRIRGIGV